MNADKLGRIVWHDLFTADAQAARTYYERVADWQFVTEHAMDFAWGGGERDFILALSGDQAGAGFVELADWEHYGWVPYVEVLDVDAAAAKAASLGGTVLKAPFEVPGVGRNCLLSDPNGALTGICLSRHSYPVPTQQFGHEIYQAGMGAFPIDFYRDLFGWDIEYDAPSGGQTASILLGTAKIGMQIAPSPETDNVVRWMPSIKVTHLPDAVGQSKGTVDEDRQTLARDPNGAFAVFVAK